MSDSKNLKLFIWPNFQKDCTNGLAIAIAENQDEARKAVIKEFNNYEGNMGHCEVYDLTKKIVFTAQGCS